MKVFYLEDEEKKLLESILPVLQQEFDYSVSDEEISLDGFLAFSQHYKSYCIHKHIIVRKHNKYANLLFVKVSYDAPSIGRLRGGITGELQIWGTAALGTPFPHTYIQRESIELKMRELIERRELYFPEDKSFSRKFYVLTENKPVTAIKLNESYRNAIQNIQDPTIVIEMIDRNVLLGNQSIANINFARQLIEHLTELAAC